MIIDNIRVSRTHALINTVGDHNEIIDLGSTAGTFVNGARVKRKELESGDVISMAEVSFIYIELSPSERDLFKGKTTPLGAQEDYQARKTVPNQLIW
jgi:pSer/pThr/pTyr-binding forkhead associated (FHA) protein